MTAYRGNPDVRTARFEDWNGVPQTPPDVAVTLIDPRGAVVVTAAPGVALAGPIAAGAPTHSYTWTPPVNANLGTWTETWTATVGDPVISSGTFRLSDSLRAGGTKPIDDPGPTQAILQTYDPLLAANLRGAIAVKGNDTALVHLAGAETLTGVKTFAIAPVLPPLPESAVANLVADLAAKQPSFPAGTYALPLGNPTIAIGDSITINSSDALGQSRGASSWFSWACLLSDSQITFARNAGIAGNKSADVLARIQTDVIAYAPKVCIIAVGVNDAYVGSVPVATYGANIRSIVSALRSANIIPVLVTVTQRSDVANALVEQYNAFLSFYSRNNGIKLVDFHGAILDPTTGLTFPAYTADGLHPNAAGAQLMGQAAADALRGYLPAWVPPLAQHQGAHALNLNPNGLFLNSTAGLGAGATKTGTGTASIVAATGVVKGNWQRLTRTDATATNFNTPGFVNYGVAGDRLAICGWFQSTSGAGGSAAVNLQTFNAGSTSSPVYNFPGTVPPHIFYGEFVIGANDIAVADMYGVLPVGGVVGDFVQLAQVTVFNLTALGSLV